MEARKSEVDLVHVKLAHQLEELDEGLRTATSLPSDRITSIN